jgi:hypothetical protein
MSSVNRLSAVLLSDERTEEVEVWEGVPVRDFSLVELSLSTLVQACVSEEYKVENLFRKKGVYRITKHNSSLSIHWDIRTDFKALYFSLT